MGKRDANKKNGAEQAANQENEDNNSSPTPAQDVGANSNANVSLINVLEEIRDFRRDIKEQLSDIKSELTNVKQNIALAETRIEGVEDWVQNVEQVLAKMAKGINNQENKLLDQEGRSRRENIRIYHVPEGAEGSSMLDFVANLLRDALDLPPDMELHIERAHRALALKLPGHPGDKPRSIIIRFLRYRMKEEILHKAWE